MRKIVLVGFLAFSTMAVAEPKGRFPATEKGAEREYPAFEINVGAAAGSTGGQSYFEIQAGVNTLFLPWLVWRNAPFYRFRSNLPNALGIDSSVLGRLSLGDSFWFDGGAGYRLATESLSAPFLEARASLNLPSFFVALGVKYLLNSVMRAGASNDVLYSVGLSAGSSL